MKVFLNEKIIVEIIEEIQLPNFPRLFLDTRRVAISNGNRFGFSEEKSKSIGSMEAWLEFEDCDEIGFDKETNMLRFVFFKYPEKTRSLTLKKLLDIKSIKASFKILPYEGEFILLPFTYRHYDSELGKLFSFSEDFLVSDNIIEIEISPDFSFYFQDEKYSGWSIKNPEIYLSDINWDFVEEPSDLTLKKNFQEIMDLTTEDNIELMEEEDNGLLLRLNSLYESSSKSNSKSSKILSTWILDLADVFYDNEKRKFFGNF
ncbi:hypothetical protein [Fluviicola taffensis]|uniref:hypothetical protein n=1 Tax=Fluviicola taffensis TaxID=191579 RepID=UPI003137904B